MLGLLAIREVLPHYARAANHDTANITLLGNYIASTFVTSSDGHGGTMISEAAMTAHPTGGERSALPQVDHASPIVDRVDVASETVPPALAQRTQLGRRIETTGNGDTLGRDGLRKMPSAMDASR